ILSIIMISLTDSLTTEDMHSFPTRRSSDLKDQWNKKQWPVLRSKLEMLFAQKTRDQWCQVLEGTDACFAPVLDFKEAKTHPHNQDRKSTRLNSSHVSISYAVFCLKKIHERT